MKNFIVLFEKHGSKVSNIQHNWDISVQAAICAAMLALAGFASAMPQGPVVSVIRDDSIAPVGAIYRTDFELDNGMVVLEEGSEGVNGVGPDGETVGPVSVSRGSYS